MIGAFSHRITTQRAVPKWGRRTLLPDGQVEFAGIAYLRPSETATAVAGKRTNGWWFFLVDQNSKRSLRDVRSDYVNAMALDAEDDEPDEDVDEDEA